MFGESLSSELQRYYSARSGENQVVYICVYFNRTLCCPDLNTECWPQLTTVHTFSSACFSVLFIIISELGFHFSSCFKKPLSYFLFNLPSLMCSVFQVAIHSVLEKLFRSIWSLPNSRAPFAIKYFFDFLDAQAENKKITDPDVVHIWKTNRWEQQ